MTVVVIGNCQTTGVVNCLSIMLPDDRVTKGKANRQLRKLSANDWLVVQAGMETNSEVAASRARTIVWPRIVFRGLHPDLAYISNSSGWVTGELGASQSKLVFAGWRAGLSTGETRGLFRRSVFERLGYLDPDHALNACARKIDLCGFPGRELVERWRTYGAFMYVVNHPTTRVLSDVSVEIAKRMDRVPLVIDATPYIPDPLKTAAVWPVYPGIAEQFGIAGNYLFKSGVPWKFNGIKAPLDLKRFIETSYEAFDREEEPDKLECGMLDEELFASVIDDPPDVDEEEPVAGEHPYRHLPDYHFWRRSVEQPARSEVRPVIEGMGIARHEAIATAGSCFAQNLAKALDREGYRYFVTERAPEELSAEDASQRQFGVYSARYGNLYTARQLVQLFDRAFGDFTPLDNAWQTPEGRWIDPFRPEIEPDRFGSPEAVEQAREEHFAHVREMFHKLDIFVFTLGLTEHWYSREDGAVFPVAPGVVGGNPSSSRYAFGNFTANEVAADLKAFIMRLRRVNPAARVIFTVSPVPLIATYEKRHVLVSSIYSKSALRVAAEEAARNEPAVFYFPSYEIIVGQHSRGEYFHDDLRTVKREGVDHVMDVFINQFANRGSSIRSTAEISSDNSRTRAVADHPDDDVVCEEELLDIG